MASIRTAIELQDNFTNVLYGIINSVNLSITAMDDMRQALSADIDTASMQGAKDEINQATIAVNEFRAAMGNMESPQLPEVGNFSRPSIPTPEPIQWQSDTMDVFSTSGVERFQQEVQSTDLMLEQLNSTQKRIGQTAETMDLLPQSAVQDISGMGLRIQELQQKIQQVESNPLNIGTGTANAELEQLRSRLNQAVQEQNHLNTALAQMDVSGANDAYMRLSQTVSGTERYIRDNVSEQGRFNREVSAGVTQTNELANTVKRMAAAYLSVQTVGKVPNLSDTMAQTDARLALTVDDGGSVEELQQKIFDSAQRSRTDYMQTADVISKLGQRASGAFSSNDETIQFAENLNKQFVIAGASQQEISSASLQLTQALGSGVLRGEEFNAIFDAAPGIIQTIADYMDVPIGKVRNMASEGVITADIVKNAMLGATDETNAQFAAIPMTFSQAMTGMKNDAIMAFQPVLQRLNDIVNSEAFQSFADGAVQTMGSLADTVLNIFDLIGQVGGFITDNWSMIEPIVLGIAAAFLLYNGYLLTHNAISAITNGLAAISAARSALKAGLTLAEAAATTTATGAQVGLNAALLACPLTWIVLAIIAVIAIVYAVVAAVNKFTGASISATGIICGAFAALGAFLWNTVTGVINAIIQFLWTSFVEPWIGIIEFVLNVFNGGFDSFGDAVANLIGQIISWFLSLGKVVTKIIDAIFGTSWTAGLSSLQDNVLEWGKNETAITLDRNAPQISRKGYEDAWDAGNKFGEGIDKKISGLFDEKDKDKNKDERDKPQDYLAPPPPPSPYGGLAGGVNDIAGNTNDIAKSLDITSEELKYLHDIAEKEAINRFTTAEIKVRQTNHNNISSGMDLDGVRDGLAAGLEEAMEIAVEGV